MSIKQPRRPSSPTSAPRRRPRVAGEVRTPTPGVAPTTTTLTAAPEPGPTPESRSRRLALPPRRTQRWLWPLAALTAAAVAFGTVATIDRAREQDDVSAQAGAEAAASSAAASAAEQILAYSYDSVDDDLAAAQDEMTPAFAKKFATVVPTVESLAQQRKLVVTATVRNVAALECGEECSPTSVRVLLYVDQDRTAAGKALDPIAVRTVLTMVERDGRWLVADSVSL